MAKPEYPGKSFTLNPDGTLTKTTRVDIHEATAVMVDVPDGQALINLLGPVTLSTKGVLVLDSFKGWVLDTPFPIVTEKRLHSLLGLPIDEPVGDQGVYDIGGEPVAARLKRGVAPSAWILLDVDPEGMPARWAALTIGQRLELFEPFLPGASKAERVECLGSTARVVK